MTELCNIIEKVYIGVEIKMINIICLISGCDINLYLSCDCVCWG